MSKKVISLVVFLNQYYLKKIYLEFTFIKLFQKRAPNTGERIVSYLRCKNVLCIQHKTSTINLLVTINLAIFSY